MDAAEIEVFLTLAEELHFTRTAERLHVPQPRVSRLVASLERRVGGALFERTSRRVTLTPLGQQLLDRVGPAYLELEAALGEASDSARGLDGALRVGGLAVASGPALTLLAVRFAARHPSCDLTMHDLLMENPFEALRSDRIDVLVDWLAVDEPDMTAGPVIEYRDRVLLVGLGHRLAGRESISFEELADEEVDDIWPGCPPSRFDMIIPPATPSGRLIRRTHSSRSVENVIRLVVNGAIVHPTVADVPGFQRRDVRQIPVPDMPPLPLGLIWCTSRENTRIRALAGIARQIGPSPPSGRARGGAETPRLSGPGS